MSLSSLSNNTSGGQDSLHSHLYVDCVALSREKRQYWWIVFQVAILAGRICNIYPLSFIVNLWRKNKISWAFQHMLVFAGILQVINELCLKVCVDGLSV